LEIIGWIRLCILFRQSIVSVPLAQQQPSEPTTAKPNIKILDRAGNDLRLQYKEMLYIRKLNPSLNRQMNSELFTLIMRNLKQENSITKDIQKYLVKSKQQRLNAN
jgi:hypothetical protein